MPETIQVLSIHDAKDMQLAVDLKDILRVLTGYLTRWTWCITSLDCQGGECDAVCQAVENASPGSWMSSEDLVKFAGGVHQVIEGTFIALPKNIDRESIEPADLDLGEFPSHRAEFAVVVVDGSWFDVFTKDPEIADLLRRSFEDVRDQNPGNFFEECRR
jgi:hypothetical protein